MNVSIFSFMSNVFGILHKTPFPNSESERDAYYFKSTSTSSQDGVMGTQFTLTSTITKKRKENKEHTERHRFSKTLNMRQ